MTADCHQHPGNVRAELIEGLQGMGCMRRDTRSMPTSPAPDTCLASVQVLIFSTSVRMLNVIEALVIFLGYSFKRLDGSTPAHERQKSTEEFNHSSCTTVFLISTLAGGLGLNLQGANKCAPQSEIQDVASSASSGGWNLNWAGLAFVQQLASSVLPSLRHEPGLPDWLGNHACGSDKARVILGVAYNGSPA